MKMRGWIGLWLGVIAILAAVLACNLVTSGTTVATAVPVDQSATSPGSPGEPPLLPASTEPPSVVHAMLPLEVPQPGQLVYDVDTQPTAAEQRTPYGDSYQINRLERPFLQDMTYVPALDVETYEVSKDSTWWYVSMTLAGASADPAAAPNYGVELDKDHDGFGDYIIWAHPPYGSAWDTAPVEIYQDTNHDTGGLTGEKSDAPLTTNGYDTKIFNGGVGDSDPDIAWVRLIAAAQPKVQFAFKKSWSGTVFMLGVLADTGLRDPGKLDYVDRFTPEQAGSPVRSNSNYPLKALYAVDNVCREAFGFAATGYEPQLCPRVEPTRKPHVPGTAQPGCSNYDPLCYAPYGIWHDYPDCFCTWTPQ